MVAIEFGKLAPCRRCRGAGVALAKEDNVTVKVVIDGKRRRRRQCTGCNGAGYLPEPAR